ncbi:MAG: hypothetical protein PUK40_00695 [Actinomycetaceae bacterium]|nr:hypothetical protein [Arcanobacterium sp.]MDD7504457.1 hypothetical protein [Actinomycetaceae bacterium]MDY6143985.1 hypothetical protein [Arcanobacterium sp.]
MAIDIPHAYARLVNALEQFHSSVMEYQDPDAPAVLRAADQLADAYTVYDDAIFTSYGVEAPFDTYAEGDEEYEDFDSNWDDDFEDGDELDEDASEENGANRFSGVYDDDEYDDDNLDALDED